MQSSTSYHIIIILCDTCNNIPIVNVSASDSVLDKVLVVLAIVTE